MKKILAALILGSLASLSFAQEATPAGGGLCDGKVGKAVPVAVGGEDTSFIQTGFMFNCSNNSFVTYTEQSPTLLTVGAASAKGSEYFGGHTDGGAVKKHGVCAATGCVLADATLGDKAAKEDADKLVTTPDEDPE